MFYSPLAMPQIALRPRGSHNRLDPNKGFKNQGMLFSPPAQDECGIRDTNIITLMNYGRHNGYGNRHRLIISHNLFQISVYNM